MRLVGDGSGDPAKSLAKNQQSRADDGVESDIRPRPQRQRPKAKADRGLPPDEQLADLAREYLNHQRKLWPELVENGLLPEPTAKVIGQMVDDFKRRHRGEAPGEEELCRFIEIRKVLGGFYGRYSCDNSSPRSIVDQLVNCLERAHKDTVFVPWIYICCDYSVSGLDSSRQGYTAYKDILGSKNHRMEVTFIDDFTRASRDEREWWSLAALSKRLGKKMIGASDNFDLSHEDWDVKLSIYALVSRLFMKGLRQKSGRGMKGAARRRTSVGRPPFGYTRRIQRDENGVIVLQTDGSPLHVRCIDPEMSKYAYKIFDMYVNEGVSPYKIAQQFNQMRVDDWAGWEDFTIKQILKNPAYIGVVIWNQCHWEFDEERKVWVRKKNPRKEWIVYYDPKLALISMDWWRAACRKRSAARRPSRATGRLLSRNEKSATTLFSGTLFCKCGRELTLIHSSKDGKSMHCSYGLAQAHGCKLSSCKSTRIIERCLLAYIFDKLLTDDRISLLVSEGNAFLEQEAKKPPAETVGLKATIRQLEKRIDKFLDRVDKATNAALIERYEKEVEKDVAEIGKLRRKLNALEIANAPPPPPLTLAKVRAYLPEIRDILNGAAPAAAAALRTLTGPITVTQEKVPGKRGARWIATFCPDFLGFLARFSKERNYPESISLEYLSKAIWIARKPVEVVIDNFPKWELLARDFRKMHAKGMNINAMASVFGMHWTTAEQYLAFALTGKQPEWRQAKNKRRNLNRQRRPPRNDYQTLVPEVLHRRDILGHSFTKIAADLRKSLFVIRKTYDMGHPEILRAARQKGATPDRGNVRRTPEKKLKVVRALIAKKWKVAEISKKTGVSMSRVYDERWRMSRAIVETNGPAHGSRAARVGACEKKYEVRLQSRTCAL